MAKEDLVKVPYAAKRLRCRNELVTQLLRQDKLKGKKVGREWLIVASSIDEYLGIENNEQDKEKDMKIRQLENEITLLRGQLTSVSQLAGTITSLIG